MTPDGLKHDLRPDSDPVNQFVSWRSVLIAAFDCPLRDGSPGILLPATAGGILSNGTGLSRYWDGGDGPKSEVISGERDAQGRTYYDLVRQYFRSIRLQTRPS